LIQEMVEVKRLILLVALVVLIMIAAGSSASVVSDNTTLDSGIPDNDLIGS
jgi:hypothetical protein